MEKHLIQKLIETVHIFYSVYELQPVEGYAEKSHHQLLLIEDFQSEESALAFIMVNVGSYHSLTIIKRYA